MSITFSLYVNILLWLISYPNIDSIRLILNSLLKWSTDRLSKLSSWMDFRLEKVSYVLGGLWRSHLLQTSPGVASFCVSKKIFIFLNFFEKVRIQVWSLPPSESFDFHWQIVFNTKCNFLDTKSTDISMFLILFVVLFHFVLNLFIP